MNKKKHCHGVFMNPLTFTIIIIIMTYICIDLDKDNVVMLLNECRFRRKRLSCCSFIRAVTYRFLLYQLLMSQVISPLVLKNLQYWVIRLYLQLLFRCIWYWHNGYCNWNKAANNMCFLATTVSTEICFVLTGYFSQNNF